MTRLTEEFLNTPGVDAISMMISAGKAADGKQEDPELKKAVVQKLLENDAWARHLVSQFQSLNINTTNIKAALIGDTLAFFAVHDPSSLLIFDKLANGLNLVKSPKSGLITSKLSPVISTSDVLTLQHLFKLLPFMSAELGDRAIALVQQEGMLTQASTTAQESFNIDEAVAHYNQSLWSNANKTAHDGFNETKAIARFNETLWSNANKTAHRTFDKTKAIAYFNGTLWSQANETVHRGFNHTEALVYFNNTLLSQANKTAHKAFDEGRAITHFNETLWSNANKTAHDNFNETKAVAYFNETLWSQANETAHKAFDAVKEISCSKRNVVDYKVASLYQAAFSRNAHKDPKEYLEDVRSAALGSDQDVKKFVVATLIEMAVASSPYDSPPTLETHKSESTCVKFNDTKGLDLNCTTSNCVISRDISDFSICVAKSDSSPRAITTLTVSAIEAIDSDLSNDCIGVVVLPSE